MKLRIFKIVWFDFEEQPHVSIVTCTNKKAARTTIEAAFRPVRVQNPVMLDEIQI